VLRTLILHQRHSSQPSEIEAAIVALGREPGGGLVIMPDAFLAVHRAPIISAAARNNVPAVYELSDFPRDGGLLSYGPDPVDNFRRAASYVDRILRGEKPGDLPFRAASGERSERRHSCTIIRSAQPWPLTSAAKMSRPFETRDLAVGFRAATSGFPARI
jgi:ABC-type uncharacterized transport system substrate-binding protein